jgi:hypothetical protein
MDLLHASTLWSSVPLDFIIKVSAAVSIRESTLAFLPWAQLPPVALHRNLQLNCLTTWFAPLWNQLAAKLCSDPWASDDPRLKLEGPHLATPTWSRKCALRTDYARRQALIEIDVLVAIALHLSLEELIQMYLEQFPVMEAYDRATWFDQKGRIVWTSSKNLVGVGLSDRATWECHKDMPEGTISKTFMDDTMPGGPVERTITYHAPFTLPDREADYERAWSFFFPKYASKPAA